MKQSIIGLMLAATLIGCTPAPERALKRAATCWEAVEPGRGTLSNDPASTEARFAAFIELLERPDIPVDTAGTLLRNLLVQAERNRDDFRLLRELCEKYLYSPDSPWREDELYLHALEPIIASAHLDDYEKLRPRYQHNMARRNRPGSPAADFIYTTVDGRQATLHNLEGAYTLLYFNNPNCPQCEAMTRALRRSRTIRRLVRNGRLRLLALYSNPEEQTERWHAHASEYPPEWIVAYDDGARICYEGLYDLRAMPCLYLLDARKRVLVKGALDIRQVVNALR